MNNQNYKCDRCDSQYANHHSIEDSSVDTNDQYTEVRKKVVGIALCDRCAGIMARRIAKCLCQFVSEGWQ
jgi:hypothetical protein